MSESAYTTADNLQVTLPLGKLPPVPTKPTLALAPHLTGAPSTPPQRDWLSNVPSWPMYANDEIGDCVWAMIGHAIKAWTTYAGTPIEVPEASVIKAYCDVTGYNPKDPTTDRGTVLQDALNYWRKAGIDGHRILAFAKVNHRDPFELQTAINLFGALMIGIEFPRSAMDQFEAGQPWTPLRRDGGIEGGHAVHFGRYSQTGYALTTWGRVQTMTGEFAAKYLDEAWIVITPEWLTAGGTTLDGVDLYGLGQEMARLTGEHNPFPGPVPAPTPAPTSQQSDQALATALREGDWVSAPHYGANARIASAGRTWLATRGL